MDQDSARIGFPPPLIYLGLLLIGFARTGFTGRLGPAGSISFVAGLPLVALGVAVIVIGVLQFRIERTATKPWRTVTSLVRTGIYRFTRNPMYLGMALIYAGLAMLLNSFTALLLLPVAIILIHTQVIVREERYLSGKFGAPYDAYRRAVPRWF